MSIEAMKQALDWCYCLEDGLSDEGVLWHVRVRTLLDNLQPVLRQAIAEAEKQEVSGLKLIHRADIDLTKKIEAEKQEPVACIYEETTFDGYLRKAVSWNKRPDSFDIGTKFYTSPPQRPVAEPHKWVGLTDEERISIRDRVQQYTPIDSVQYGFALQVATEQAIKEKNT